MFMNFTERDLKNVIDRFNLNLKSFHKNINIEGSPERSNFRIVFE